VYYYMHVNGTVIPKVDFVVDSLGAADYFDSPFVMFYWHVDDTTHRVDIGTAPEGWKPPKPTRKQKGDVR